MPLCADPHGKKHSDSSMFACGLHPRRIRRVGAQEFHRARARITQELNLASERVTRCESRCGYGVLVNDIGGSEHGACWR